MSKLIELFSSDAFKEAAAEDAKNSGVGVASILDGLMSTVGSFGNLVGEMEGTTRLRAQSLRFYYSKKEMNSQIRKLVKMMKKVRKY